MLSQPSVLVSQNAFQRKRFRDFAARTAGSGPGSAGFPGGSVAFDVAVASLVIESERRGRERWRIDVSGGGSGTGCGLHAGSRRIPPFARIPAHGFAVPPRLRFLRIAIAGAAGRRHHRAGCEAGCSDTGRSSGNIRQASKAPAEDRISRLP